MSLLEFLGLTANKSGRIVNIHGRRSSDIGIEHFSNASGHLSMLNPETARLPSYLRDQIIEIVERSTGTKIIMMEDGRTG